MTSVRWRTMRRYMVTGASTFIGSHLPEATMNGALARLEGLAGRRLEVLHARAVAGGRRRTKAGPTRIREALGRQPRTALDDGLGAEWKWASARVAAG